MEEEEHHHHHHHHNGDVGARNIKRGGGGSSSSSGGGSQVKSQLRALMLKNFALQGRQKKTNACQICIPLALIILVGVTQILFQIYVIDAFHQGAPVYGSPQPLSFPQLYASGNGGLLQWFIYPIYVSTSNAFVNQTLGSLLSNGTKTGLLSEVQQEGYGGVQIPYTQWWDNDTYLDEQISAIKHVQITQDGKGHCDQCPPAAWVVYQNDPSVASPLLNYTIMTDDQTGHSPDMIETTSISLLHSAFFSSLNATSQIIVASEKLPYVETPPEVDIASFLATLLYPFTVSFLLPVYMYAVVLEKQERLREMMKMMGMRMKWYWAINYAYDMLLYTAIILVLLAVSFGFQLRFFTQTSMAVILLLFFGWGIAQVSLAVFLSALFNKARSATIVGYLLVIAGVISSYVLNITVYDMGTLPPIYCMLYPPYAFYRSIYLMGARCGFFACYQWDDFVWPDQLSVITLMLYVEAVVFFVAGLYLDAVLPKEFGVAEHPLFFIMPLWNKLKNSASKRKRNEEPTEYLLARERDISDPERGDDSEDPDVAAEKNRMQAMSDDDEAAVHITALRKEYPTGLRSSKVAVKELWLSLREGECFALLGPNGAGKTTTISILTGLFPPTSGTAYVGGFDIRDQMDDVHQIMSVCPQFDTFWEELTVKETLLFYARLKCVDRKLEEDAAIKTIGSVGLAPFADRLARDLSGGMKRRLSLGIALVGDPKVIFLDEPTTGLDPETKRGIWDVMLEVKKGRCVILTTHSMEEADVLCDRIGIMSLGRLKCLGTPLQLKNKYGKGYSLMVNCDVTHQQSLIRFVKEHFPSAVLEESFGGTCMFIVPTKDMKVSRVFQVMQAGTHNLPITDWSINQASLQDVFVNVAETDDVEQTD